MQDLLHLSKNLTQMSKNEPQKEPTLFASTQMIQQWMENITNYMTSFYISQVICMRNHVKWQLKMMRNCAITIMEFSSRNMTLLCLLCTTVPCLLIINTVVNCNWIIWVIINSVVYIYYTLYNYLLRLRSYGPDLAIFTKAAGRSEYG